MSDPIFLTLNQVLQLHSRQIEQFGGADGVRDIDLIKSAIAQPSSGFGGQSFHPDLIAKAAAYLFHLVSNHGFVDGNKRIGVATALVFLDMNGVEIDSIDDNALESLTLAVASGTSTNADVDAFLSVSPGRKS